MRQHGTCHLFVCGFSARSAEKPHTIEKECTALPKAQYANCVSPINALRLARACIFRLTRHSTLIAAVSCGESAVVSIAMAKSAASYHSHQRRVRKDNADAAVFAEGWT